MPRRRVEAPRDSAHDGGAARAGPRHRRESGTAPKIGRSLPELVLERVGDGVIALDREGRCTYVNPQAARIFGKPAEGLLGQSLWALYPEAAAGPFFEACKRAEKSQVRSFVESYYPSWDRWFESRVYPSEDGLAVFFQDISERKRAEALLVGQTQMLELIASEAALSEVLDALLRLLEAQCKGMRCTILLLDEDRLHLRHGAAPSMPESFTQPIDGAAIGPRAGSCGTAAFRGEPVLTMDIESDPLWDDWRTLALSHGLRASWSTPIFDVQRRVLGTFAMYFSEAVCLGEREQALVRVATHIASIAITHERAEAARKQSESRYRRLVESNLIGVLIADAQGVIREANDEFLRIVGHSRADLTSGQLCWDALTPAEYRAVDAEIVARLSAARGCPGYTKECFHRDGHRVWIRVTSALLDDAEGDSICLVEDLTERMEQARMREKNRELEESNRAAQEATRLKSEFLANMSHELRTPLNAVLGFSEYLLDEKPGQLNTKQRECLEHVLTSGRHLLRLISDVLDLAKVEAGKMEIAPEEFRLGALLEEVCAIARALADERNIAVTLSCDPELDRVILDPQKLKQVLFNLLGNAVKFTDGGGCIEVSARAIEHDRLEIRIQDNGVGISAEDLPKLFHEFQQLDSSSSRRHEGTGLGLVLAKRLVEGQRGRIGVESTLGVGSTFYIVLPRAIRGKSSPRLA